MANPRELLKPIPTQKVPDQDDLQYAQAFVDVARCIEHAQQSELLALRLSTCRNAYLTVNALFVDIQHILGHGKLPSPLSRALEHVRRHEASEADLLFDKVRSVIDTMQRKRLAWDTREALDAELEEYIRGLTKLEQDRLRGWLADVRTNSKGHSWHARFYELGQEEPGHLRHLISELDGAQRIIEAVVDIGRSLCAAIRIEEVTLFSDSAPKYSWHDTLHLLRKHASHLDMVSTRRSSTDQEPLLGWTNESGQAVMLPDSTPAPDEAGQYYRLITTQLVSRVAALYDHLLDTFSPNEAVSKLPAPFRIDVTDRQLHQEATTKRFSVRVHDFQHERPKIVRLALLACGVPLEYYDQSQLRYESDDRRREVARIADAALSTAAERGVNLVVFPECFLPMGHCDSLVRKASHSKIVLVAGEEGSPSVTDHHLINQAIVAIPGFDAPVRQLKSRRSVYEPPLAARETNHLHVFDRTPIGSFAVLICSDFHELDLIAELESAPRLIDFLLVPSFNPRPDLFEAFAVADAARLYCHVVIANSFCTDPKNVSSDRGSLVCSPMSKLVDAVRKDGEIVPLQLPAIGGVQPSLRVYDVSVESLARTAGRAAPGWLAVPHCRGRAE